MGGGLGFSSGSLLLGSYSDDRGTGVLGYNLVENYLSLSQQSEISICIMARGGIVPSSPVHAGIRSGLDFHGFVCGVAISVSSCDSIYAVSRCSLCSHWSAVAFILFLLLLQ